MGSGANGDSRCAWCRAFAHPARSRGDERRRHHLRLPAQHLRVRGDPSPGAGRGPSRDRRLQHLRGDRRGGAAIASGHPPAQARAAGGAHRGHGLRGADRAWTLRGHARGRAGPGQRGEAQRTGLARAPGRAGARAVRHRRRGEGRRQRHHDGDADGDAPHRRRRRARARLRAGAERLRPPLHLLHHPLWPRQFAFGADGRGGRAGAHAVRARLSRSRPHRRRSHQLRRQSSGRAEAWHAGQADPQTRAGARAVAALVDRFGRSRSRPARCVCERRTADAASAPVAAVGRRSHPEADEAPAPARRCHRLLPAGAPPAARRGVRRRHHRRLPDRNRGHVRPLARSGRGMRADASACVSVLAAAGDAGRAYAPACIRHRQGSRAPAARKRRGGDAPASRCAGRRSRARC